jgi:hypothetical protein
VDLLVFLGEVPVPVVLEVTVADQGPEFEDGFGLHWRILELADPVSLDCCREVFGHDVSSWLLTVPGRRIST